MILLLQAHLGAGGGPQLITQCFSRSILYSEGSLIRSILLSLRQRLHSVCGVLAYHLKLFFELTFLLSVFIHCGQKMLMFKKYCNDLSWGSSMVLFVTQSNHNDLISVIDCEKYFCPSKLYVNQQVIKHKHWFYLQCNTLQKS